ncbi:hypothetical protein O181_099548, partial [Austropuccinia psidii MF-1]|nr:hypothetical protein [Austropuccinia psidii MF-1]
MASSGHFDPSQTYDGFREVEVLDPACTECLAKGKDCFQHYNPRSSKCHFCFIGKKPCRRTGVTSSNIRRHLWSRKDGPFGQEFPIPEEPTPDATSGLSQLTGSRKRDVARWTNVGGPIPVGGRPLYSSSEVPISRTHTEVVVKIVKRVRRIDDPPLIQMLKEVMSWMISKPNNSQHSQNLLTNSGFHSYYHYSSFTQYFPCQACLESRSKTISSSAIQKLTHKPVVSSIRRRDGLSPLLFPAAEVSQRRELWPIGVTREEPNMDSENQDAVARLFRRVDRNSRE